MQRIRVSSSNIHSVGYDALHHILEIEFLSGGVYYYSKVPHNVYSGLMNANSHGGYFSAYIKNVYPCTKIR